MQLGKHLFMGKIVATLFQDRKIHKGYKAFNLGTAKGGGDLLIDNFGLLSLTYW
jgi:hypothetical protein